jgi:hypothetical protein
VAQGNRAEEVGEQGRNEDHIGWRDGGRCLESGGEMLFQEQFQALKLRNL